MWKINTTVKKIFTYITATCIYNHINRKNLYDWPQNRPFIVQLKKHFTYKWCCESNSEHQIFRWFWDLSEYRPLHYRISLATVSELCPLYVERSVRNPATCSDRVVLPDMYGNVSLWTSLAVGLSMLYTTSRLHTCQASVFVTPVQVFIPVPCYTSFRYLRGHRACFLLAAWTRTIPIFSSPICNTIWKSKNKINITDDNNNNNCDTDYDL